MTEFVRFKSRSGRNANEWLVIKDGARSVDIESLESGRILMSVNRDRLETITQEQEPTP